MLEHPRDLSGTPCQNGGVLFEEARLPDTVVGSSAASSIRVTGKAPILRRSARVVFADGPPLATRCGPPSLAADVSHPDLPERRFRLLCESVNSSRAAADCGAGAGKGRACRLKEGRARTSDLSGCSTTTDVTNAVIEKLARPYHTPGTSR
jgi:hypothetical protein